MKYLLILIIATLACGEQSDHKDDPITRSFGVQVCYNPSSIWHLSECNANCTLRDYTGDAHCFAVSETICQDPAEDHIRRACGLYGQIL
mgnify:CR=1 FL=1